MAADLVVNATPLGMEPHVDAMPVPASWLHAEQWVYDLVYRPRLTALLRAATAQGCRTLDGVAMLVYQGAEAFTIWTGLPAPATVMEQALDTYWRSAPQNTSG
jgi:shikimate dehydrogenase